MEVRYNNGKRELHPLPEGSTFAGGRPTPAPARMSRPPPAPRPRPPPQAAPVRSGPTCSVGAALLVIFIIKVIIVLVVLAAYVPSPCFLADILLSNADCLRLVQYSHHLTGCAQGGKGLWSVRVVNDGP
jgi:hypothetical protein